MTNYSRAREIVEEGVKAAFALMKADEEQDEDDDDLDESGEFHVNKQEAFAGRWVAFFETTAPATHTVEGEEHFTYAKGFYCISGDGVSSTSLTEWEIRGMIDYARDKDIFG